MSRELEDAALPQQHFDEYLHGDSEVSVRYRQLGKCPAPRALDARVWQQVDEHLQPQTAGGPRQLRKPRGAARGRGVRWSASLAVAATLLLGVSVVLDDRVRQPAKPALLVANPVDDRGSSLVPAREADPQTSGDRAKPESVRNYATMNPNVARDDQFFLGRREPTAGQSRSTSIAPYRSSSALVLSSTNANRERTYVQSAAAGDRPTAAATQPAATGPAASPSSLEEDRSVAPEVWVERIRRARAQRKLAQADTLLERLRAVHPGFAVPADIAVPDAASRRVPP